MGKRHTAAARKLPKVYAKHFGVCCYCGDLTIMVRDVQDCLFFKQKAFTVQFLLGAELVDVPFATVDHVLDQEFGGGHSYTNLVLSCALCNQLKNRSKHRRQKQAGETKDKNHNPLIKVYDTAMLLGNELKGIKPDDVVQEKIKQAQDCLEEAFNYLQEKQYASASN